MAKFFLHIKYEGMDWELGIGEYPSVLDKLGVLSDQMSSVKIPPNFKVKIFDGLNFTGRSLELTSDCPDFVEKNFNDLVRSIKIYV